MTSRCPIYRLTIDRIPSYTLLMATDAHCDIDISLAPGSRESPATDGREQQAMSQPPGRGGGSLLAFAALLLLLLGALALLILVFQPFADQAGGCGGG